MSTYIVFHRKSSLLEKMNLYISVFLFSGYLHCSNNNCGTICFGHHYHHHLLHLQEKKWKKNQYWRWGRTAAHYPQPQWSLESVTCIQTSTSWISLGINLTNKGCKMKYICFNDILSLYYLFLQGKNIIILLAYCSRILGSKEVKLLMTCKNKVTACQTHYIGSTRKSSVTK